MKLSHLLIPTHSPACASLFWSFARLRFQRSKSPPGIRASNSGSNDIIYRLWGGKVPLTVKSEQDEVGGRVTGSFFEKNTPGGSVFSMRGVEPRGRRTAYVSTHWADMIRWYLLPCIPCIPCESFSAHSTPPGLSSTFEIIEWYALVPLSQYGCETFLSTLLADYLCTFPTMPVDTSTAKTLVWV